MAAVEVLVREAFTARGPACMAPAVMGMEGVMEGGKGTPPAVRHGPLHRMERRSDPKGPSGWQGAKRQR